MREPALLFFEYIVANELTHLVVRNHNERFVALLDVNMPNWKIIKEELNEFIV